MRNSQRHHCDYHEQIGQGVGSYKGVNNQERNSHHIPTTKKNVKFSNKKLDSFPSGITTKEKLEKQDMLRLINNIKSKYADKKDGVGDLRYWDIEGKRQISKDNIKSILSSMGYNLSQTQLNYLMKICDVEGKGYQTHGNLVDLLIVNKSSSEKAFMKKLSDVDDADMDAECKKYFNNKQFENSEKRLYTVLANDYKNFSQDLRKNLNAGSIDEKTCLSLIEKNIGRLKNNPIEESVIKDVIECAKTENGKVNGQKLLENIGEYSSINIEKIRKQSIRDDLDSYDENRDSQLYMQPYNTMTKRETLSQYNECCKGNHSLQKNLTKRFSNKENLVKHLEQISKDMNMYRPDIDRKNNLISKKNIFDLFDFEDKNKDKDAPSRNEVYKFLENIPFRPGNTTSLVDFSDLVFGDIDGNFRLMRNDYLTRPVPPFVKSEFINIDVSGNTGNVSHWQTCL